MRTMPRIHTQMFQGMGRHPKKPGVGFLDDNLEREQMCVCVFSTGGFVRNQNLNSSNVALSHFS